MAMGADVSEYVEEMARTLPRAKQSGVFGFALMEHSHGLVKAQRMERHQFALFPLRQEASLRLAVLPRRHLPQI